MGGKQTQMGHKQMEQLGERHTAMRRDRQEQKVSNRDRQTDTDSPRRGRPQSRRQSGVRWLLTWARQGWRPPELWPGSGGTLWEG